MNSSSPQKVVKTVITLSRRASAEKWMEDNKADGVKYWIHGQDKYTFNVQRYL